MARTTIDFGIDFGTTNSAIACLQRDRVEVIKNSLTQSDLTPSAVFVDGKGAVIVGAPAYSKLEFDPDNSIGGFKRWLGGENRFTFKKSGRSMKAEELSAEVLKSLKGDVFARFQEDIKAAVITVPAVWEIPKCEATRRAAQLAGLEFTPLLQEPIAAAIGYGFQAEELRGVLMVFDLGGGTFDTSLLSARDGRLTVLGNEGCLLGGRDFDLKLAEWLADRIEKESGVRGLRRDNPLAYRAFAKLKQKAEEAKKQLSVRESCPVSIEELGSGFENVEITIEVHRRDYEQLIAADTNKAISICKGLLAAKGIKPSALQALLLVGGPTLTPYIRASIEQELGIRPSSSLDPMTVVAQGAALFAATQRLQESSKAAPRTGQINARFHYSPVSDSTETDVGISLDPPLNGGELRIIRTDGGWASAVSSIPPDGQLFVTVLLRAKKSNEFRLEIKDANGTLISPQPSEFTITHGLPLAQAITSKDFGVALENNEFEVLIPKGTPLPAKGAGTFQTSKTVSAGSQESALKVYILEGEHQRADRNLEIQVMELRGAQCKRSLPAGETVEVIFRMDESRVLSATAFIPFLNQTIESVFKPLETRIKDSREPDEIEQELNKEAERCNELRGVTSGNPGLSEFEQRAQDLKKELDAAKAGDQEARQKIVTNLLDLKAALDTIEDSTRWQRLLSEFSELKEAARELFATRGSQEQSSQLELLITEAEDAASRKSLQRLDQRLESIRGMYWRLLFSFDEYWISAFRRLESDGARFVDSDLASRLIEEGKRAIGRQDIESLKTIVPQLWGLLPESQQSKLDFRFADAGLRRAYGRQK
jgi:molecular chaperone DnaK